MGGGEWGSRVGEGRERFEVSLIAGPCPHCATLEMAVQLADVAASRSRPGRQPALIRPAAKRRRSTVQAIYSEGQTERRKSSAERNSCSSAFSSSSSIPPISALRRALSAAGSQVTIMLKRTHQKSFLRGKSSRFFIAVISATSRRRCMVFDVRTTDG